MQTRFLTLLTFCLTLVMSVPAGAVSSVVFSQDAAAAPVVANGFGGSRISSLATAQQTTNAPQLTRAEQKSARKSVRKSVREQLRGAGGAVSKIALIIIAIFIPPLAMLLYDGVTKRFWISLLLTLLFFLPGLIYTIYVIASGR